MAIELTTANNAVLSQIQTYTSQGIMWSVFPNVTAMSFAQGQIETPFSASVMVADYGGVMDCYTLARCRRVQVGGFGTSVGQYNVQTINNASVLTLLQDVGTTSAFDLARCRLDADALNTLFTDLPSTVNTATIYVSSTNGAASCNTTIATSKGYTVVT